jgi:hypothetical protein
MRSTELQAPSWSALLLAAVPLRAQAPADAGAPFEPYDAIVERVIELGASDSRVQEHLEYLARSIGPRLTGSGNLTRACRWAEARFADLGLEARLEEWGTIEVGFDKLRERGAMVAPERMELAFETHAWTAGTPGPLRAPARLEPKTLEELETARGALAGAWIV